MVDFNRFIQFKTKLIYWEVKIIKSLNNIENQFGIY